MSKTPSYGTAMLLGAALMYFLDPAQGRRRRAALRDQASHARRVEQVAAGKAGRDLSQRLRGILQSLRQTAHRKDSVEDARLEARVRARLGHAITHPGAIHVEAHDGNVLVRGPILAYEHDRAVRAIRAVPGVCDVVDRMQVRESAGSEPALQGAGRALARRPSWPPAERAAVLGLATLLYAWGAVRKHGISRTAARTAGGALALRALADRPLRELFGFGEPDVTVRKSITVFAPLDEVFEMWTRFDRFPKFMDHVREVTLHAEDPRVSIWIVDGPAGMPLRFEAELTEYVAGRKVGWKTRPGQMIEHSGIVRFEPTEGGTRVHVQMRYVPPGGAAGHAVARILGWDPKKRMDADLLRMKALLECGRTRAHHHRVAIDELS